MSDARYQSSGAPVSGRTAEDPTDLGGHEWFAILTYGTLRGTIGFLVWLWIPNIALLFGAELNSEIERPRELAAGERAEDELKVEPRDIPKTPDSDRERAVSRLREA